MNGKIVDIRNIDIFEAAAEGAAINRTLPNIIPNEGLGIDFDYIEKMINVYKIFYSKLPFPLNSIDNDVKYCAAGLVIKKETQTKNRMWIDNGLFICIDKERNLALGFINQSWGIVKVNEIKEDNLIIDKYKGKLGFDEFIWVVASIFNNEDTRNYYSKFMAPFVDACGNQPMVLKWELGNILQFGSIPERKILPLNKIVDLDSNDTYSLDIFVAGSRKSKKKNQVWGLDDPEVQIENKIVNVYGYDLYVKPQIRDGMDASAEETKAKPTELYGINSLFCTLCSIKLNDESEVFPEFKGFITSNRLIYLVDNRLFIANSRNYTDAKEVAKNVDIYGFKDNYVYIEKSKIISTGIKKETIYSYSLEDNGTRLCKIQFSRV